MGSLCNLGLSLFSFFSITKTFQRFLPCLLSMEAGIHFAETVLKLSAKSCTAQSAPQTTPVFVVSAYVLSLELTMDVV